MATQKITNPFYKIKNSSIQINFHRTSNKLWRYLIEKSSTSRHINFQKDIFNKKNIPRLSCFHQSRGGRYSRVAIPHAEDIFRVDAVHHEWQFVSKLESTVKRLIFYLRVRIFVQFAGKIETRKGFVWNFISHVSRIWVSMIGGLIAFDVGLGCFFLLYSKRMIWSYRIFPLSIKFIKRIIVFLVLKNPEDFKF